MRNASSGSGNRQKANLMIGPPQRADDLKKMMTLFFSLEGKRIVCGGTTSQLAAVYLNKPLEAKLNYTDENFPPIGRLEGVDLVTEGVLTLGRVLDYGREFKKNGKTLSQKNMQCDGASLIIRILFEEAVDIHFLVGTSVNPAHRNSNQALDPAMKIRLVEELIDCLRKSGKKVTADYY